MNRYWICAPVLSLTFAACTKEVKVDIPEHQPTLVVSSNTVVDDTFRLQVGKSAAILKYKYNLDLSVTNATVLLYEGDKVIAMSYDKEQGIYTAPAIAETGKNYTVKVSAPGFKSVEANTEVPSAVKIKSIKRYPKARVDINGMEQDEVRISFDDPSATGDFYVLRFLSPPVEDTFRSGPHMYSSCVNTNDPSVESIYNESIDQNTCLSSDGIFFRDALFNGTTKELRLFIASDALRPIEDIDGNFFYPSIELYHVTEAYFRYQKSYQFASENTGNPFAEPTNVYSNVKDGYGIFSVASIDYEEIK